MLKWFHELKEEVAIFLDSKKKNLLKKVSILKISTITGLFCGHISGVECSQASTSREKHQYEYAT